MNLAEAAECWMYRRYKMSLSMSLVPVAIGILITTVKGLSSIEEKHIVDDKHLENVETYFKKNAHRIWS